MNDRNEFEILLKSVTPAEIAAFDMSRHITNLMIEEPFWGRFSRIMNFKRTEEIPTAGVCVRDGEMYLMYNPRFTAALKCEQKADGTKSDAFQKNRGLLKHEFMHLLFEHCTSRTFTNHEVGNIAQDLAINSLLPVDELPNCGIWPGKSELKGSTDAVKRLIGDIEKEKSAEWYYSRLMENESVKKRIENGEYVLTGEKKIGDCVIGGETMDSHGGWGKMSDAEREIARITLREAAREAAEHCDRAGNWGSIPSVVRQRIRDFISSQINWQKVLHSWVGMTRCANRTTTYRRVNKRFPGILPGTQHGFTSFIACYVDQSGSVSDREQELLFSELNNLSRHREFDLFVFDTEVDEGSKITIRRGSKASPFRSRNGGTDFSAPNEHAKKNKVKYDGFLILTDGCAPDPGPSPRGLRRLWVVTPNNKLNFNPSPGDVVITMEWPKKNND